MTRSGLAGGVLEWAVAGQPLTGQAVSGDLHLVAPFSGGVLVAVIDGLGHGPDAAAASMAAAEVLLEDAGLPVEALITRCHRALGRLRGAVMSIASFDVEKARIGWIGVGNVETILLRADPAEGQPRHERLLLWGGVVGQTLPTLRPQALRLHAGDTVVFATDGVRTTAFDDIRATGSVEDIADGILEQHRKGNDDALVLAARYRGAPRD